MGRHSSRSGLRGLTTRRTAGGSGAGSATRAFTPSASRRGARRRGPSARAAALGGSTTSAVTGLRGTSAAVGRLRRGLGRRARFNQRMSLSHPMSEFSNFLTRLRSRVGAGTLAPAVGAESEPREEEDDGAGETLRRAAVALVLRGGV